MQGNKWKGVLCYLFGWVTGIIFYLIEKDSFVRFHAMQSILTFGALSILDAIVSFLESVGGHALWSIFHPLNNLIGLITFILWIVLMVKAYQGERFKLPFVGDLAESITSSV